MRHIPLESHPLRQPCESWNAKFNARRISKYTAGEPCKSMSVRCVYRDCWYSSPILGQPPVTNATRVKSPSLSTISACRKPITVENKNSTLHLLLEIYAHTDTTQTAKRTVQVKWYLQLYRKQTSDLSIYLDSSKLVNTFELMKVRSQKISPHKSDLMSLLDTHWPGCLRYVSRKDGLLGGVTGAQSPDLG